MPLRSTTADPQSRVPWFLVAVAVVLLTAGPAHATPSSSRPRAGTTALEGERRIGPPLTGLRAKIADATWLVAWLLKPSRLRHRPFMRNFRVNVEEAQAMAGYLYAGPPPVASHVQWRGGDARKGETLFVTRGCRGCHAIGPTETSAVPLAANLAGIGVKVRGDWLFNWLKSPRSYDPDTAMPAVVLNDDDLRHLVAFLLSHREGAAVVAAAPRFRPGVAPDVARDAIRRFDCPKCHLISGFQVIAAPTRWAAEPKGCANCHEQNGSSSPPPATPPKPVESTAAALENGRRLVTYYGCRGCHRIEGDGGVIAQHLERKTLAPPTLEGEGARVQTSWLINFLEHPTNLRPWLQIRMPDYGLSRNQTVALANYFAALAQIPMMDEPLVVAPAATAALGLRRFTHFKCLQCHPVTPDAQLPHGVDPEDVSINLALAKSRLRPAWIRDFLARPKMVVGPQTRMPAVFYTVDGLPKVDDPERDIATITAYLLQATSPSAEAAGKSGDGPQQEIDWTTHPY